MEREYHNSFYQIPKHANHYINDLYVRCRIEEDVKLKEKLDDFAKFRMSKLMRRMLVLIHINNLKVSYPLATMMKDLKDIQKNSIYRCFRRLIDLGIVKRLGVKRDRWGITPIRLTTLGYHLFSKLEEFKAADDKRKRLWEKEFGRKYPEN